MKEFEFNKKTNLLRVFMRSPDPAIKGVRMKAQKYLKSKGLYDATCWHEYTLPHPDGSIVVLHVSSAILSLKKLTEDVRL